MFNFTPQSLYPRRIIPVPTEREAVERGVSLEPVRTV
jgi:hypothetical protein